MPKTKSPPICKLRTSISMNSTVFDWARKIQTVRGFSALSDLMEHLVRAEYERLEMTQAAVIQGREQ